MLISRFLLLRAWFLPSMGVIINKKFHLFFEGRLHQYSQRSDHRSSRNRPDASGIFLIIIVILDAHRLQMP